MQKQTEQAPGQPGLVISYFGNSVAVEAPDGQVFQCHLRRNQPLPVVGDKVIWQPEQEQGGRIVSIEPRQSLLRRGDLHGKTKLIAANVDVMLVVMSPPPVFSAPLVDHYLVAAEVLGITPVIVLNKVDLVTEPALTTLNDLLQRYRNIPYQVFMTSVISGEGMQALDHYLHNKVSVLVGPSGVGKSSIISAISEQDIRVNEVSPKGTGKHTTTATRFYHLPQGGGVIDSPGVRDFSLWSVSPAEVLHGFKELGPFLSGCKFRDCSHTVEPQCSVQQAVADGKISPERFSTYQQLMKAALQKDKK